jgi:hypothetical protein
MGDLLNVIFMLVCSSFFEKTTKYPWGFGRYDMHGLQLFLNKLQ